ncbi:MAG: response regulator [Proteobacteria bacterium]|nr:response regulator [Pseudomonadota bacterium]
MPTESEYPDYTGCPLLIVEDNKVNQIVARKILSKANFTVSLANNGQEAMEMVQNQAFELVLMDIQMPVMDGFQAVKAIRELGGKFAELPIIAMPAHTLASDKQKSLDGGMNDHVTKPISPEQLFQAIAH